MPPSRLQADFDRIAELVAAEPEEADPYEAFLLSKIPASCRTLLEVGCGAGRLSRAVAARGINVTGIDVSPAMIRLARERAGRRAIAFECADFMACPVQEVDCVLTVATLHHLDQDEALVRMKAFVRPGGTLVLHDVRAPSGAHDWLGSGVTALVNGDAWRWIRRHHRRSSELRAAWQRHGAGERYLTMGEARALCARHLPGAEVQRHPLWRYTATWARPRG